MHRNRHVTSNITFRPFTSKCLKKKHPWMFKQPKSATEVQKETSFSGRPLRRKSCMQLHLIGCSGWFHGSGSDSSFFLIPPTDVPFGWENLYREKRRHTHISVKKRTSIISFLVEKFSLVPWPWQNNDGNLSTLARRQSTPMQLLGQWSPSGQILSVDLPSPL